MIQSIQNLIRLKLRISAFQRYTRIKFHSVLITWNKLQIVYSQLFILNENKKLKDRSKNLFLLKYLYFYNSIIYDLINSKLDTFKV